MSKEAEKQPYMPPSREGKVGLTIWTSVERRQELKVLAAQAGMTVQDIIEAAVDKEMAKIRRKLEDAR